MSRSSSIVQLNPGEIMELPSADRWTQINELLQAAQAKPGDERAAFLEKACGDDELLREQVETLLAAASSYGHMFDEGAAVLAEPLLPASGDVDPDAQVGPLKAGQHVGAYRLMERIGEGGTSVVYRAVRVDEQFERTVAVKILKRTVDAEDETATRFRAEQQILASLSHPHLAEVYDGGVLEDGRPYLVMEHVDGRPITEYCRTEGLSINERLQLFRQAAAAVQAAHEQLVVHRDLKPSNVLVDGETETVKLLDFGIAKILGDVAGAPAPTTQTGRQPMTPAYAAPEQVKGEAISVAADTYALGVLLYELLTDERPYGGEDRSPYAVARAVCEEDPPLPSEAVADVERGRTLEGDLDAIVMRALRKTPDARYDTVDDLLDDLERYRANLPVRAQRGSWAYRTRKFVRRHRTMLMGTLTGILLLGGFLIYHVQQLSAQRDAANREAETAEQVTEFLVDLFERSNPVESATDTVTARDLLERGRGRASTLTEQPAVKARLLDAMGQAYLGLGQHTISDSLLREAHQLRRRVYGPNSPEIAAGLDHLAEAANEQGHYAVAESLGQRVLSVRRTARDSIHPEVAESLHDLAHYKQQTGDYAAAESLYKESLSLKKQLYEPPSRQVATGLSELAHMLTERGEYAVAESLSQEALSLRRRLFGDTHPKTSESVARLARAKQGRGRLAEAESLYREALAVDREVFGPEHPIIGTDLNDLATVLENRNKLAEAESLQRKALELSKKELRPDHPDLLATTYNLAVLLHERGRYKEAASYYQRILPRLRKKYAGPHPHLAFTLASFGDVRRDQGQFAVADSLYQTALKMLKAVFGEKNPQLVPTMGKMAALHKEREQYDKAEDWLQRALALQREATREDNPDVAKLLQRLADLSMEQGDATSAEPLYREALAIWKEENGGGTWRRAVTEARLGACLMEQGRYAEAERLLTQSYQVLNEELGPSDENAQRVARDLVRFYEERGRPEEAEKYRRLAETSKEE